MVADVSGVCFLFFSDQSKISNRNTERVNGTSQQSKNHLEGKLFIQIDCTCGHKSKEAKSSPVTEKLGA